MMLYNEAEIALKTAIDSLQVLKGLDAVFNDKAAQDALENLQTAILAAQKSTLAANEISEKSRGVCQECAYRGITSGLLATSEMRRGQRVYRCGTCKSEYVFDYVLPPSRSCLYDPYGA